MNYRTPGVYVEEISTLPASVAQVETAIPAFIGYTVKTSHQNKKLVNKPRKIRSLKEFEEIFGTTSPTIFANGPDGRITLKSDGKNLILADNIRDPHDSMKSWLYYALQMFYVNGGGTCYIVSCGEATAGREPDKKDFLDALKMIRKERDVTLILFPDGVSLSENDYYSVSAAALEQCTDLKNRMTLIDILKQPQSGVFRGDDDFSEVGENFRTKIGDDHLMFGAAYYPWLQTNLNYVTDESEQEIAISGRLLGAFSDLRKVTRLRTGEGSRSESGRSLYDVNRNLYNMVRHEMNKFRVIMPPASAMAGIYAYVDRTRGVWKAPANVSLSSVQKPMTVIGSQQQASMNVHPSGKSVNAIRTFSGKGVLVWGARTLAGNDNEWRYVPVRRLACMIEASVSRALNSMEFEPNNENTWNKVRSMIGSFLDSLWRDGALQGPTPQDAFFVQVGPGVTMSPQDVSNGRMIVEIGIAAIRPAEFIILRFEQKTGQS